MKKDNHIVFEIIKGKICYICKLDLVFKKSQYKYACNIQNFPLKISQEKYYTFLLDTKRDYHTWESFIEQYDIIFSIKE